MVTTISQRSGRAAHPKDPEEDQEDHEQTGLGGGAENPGTLQVFRGQRQIKFMSIQKRKKNYRMGDFDIAMFEYQGMSWLSCWIIII